MHTIEVEVKVKDDTFVPAEVEVVNISYARPYLEDKLPNGTYVYLKGNPKPLHIKQSYEEYRQLRKVLSEFYQKLSKLDNDSRKAIMKELDLRIKL